MTSLLSPPESRLRQSGMGVKCSTIVSSFWPLRPSWIGANLLLFFLFSVSPCLRGESSPARPGSVSFSNGSSLDGEISLTPGYTLTLHDGKNPHSIPMESIREIRFAPEKEELAKAWRFKEAGQAIKEEWGKPFPVRELEATVLLKEGESWKGHLHTLPLYVTATGATTRVVILAKQRGKPGETLESLVYPLSVRFDDSPAASNRLARLTLKPDPGAGAAVCAITAGTLIRLPAKRASTNDPFRIEAPLGAPLFMAIQRGDTLTAAWKSEAEPDVIAVVTQAVSDARDFFDRKMVMGVRRDGDQVYALVMLARVGHTTLDAKASQPWRLEIWRFKMEPESRKVMLAARNWFFRGITEPGVLRSPVTVDEGVKWDVAPP